jgi:hypothetical protein
MSDRYTVTAMTGLNDAVGMLKPVDKHPLVCPSFADARADIVNRAENLRKYLDSAGCDYRVRSESGDHRYEVSFEYGPPSLGCVRPFKMVLHACRWTLRRGQIHAVEL